MGLPITSRLQTYFDVNTQLSMLSNQTLIEQFAQQDKTQGWGINQILTVGQHPVFVKRIPLTEVEYARSFDTSNHFNLPMFYHYGMGSAGFGAFRELQTHIKTTNEVLSKKTACYPLLYHYRILPATATWKTRSPKSLKKHLAYWNNSNAIGDYLQARASAAFEIALFLEYIPYSLLDWFKKYPQKNLASFFRQTHEGLNHLQKMGILHLDAHLANVLTDGKAVFISDFGLALDKEFQLETEEINFFEQHQGYDQAELLSCLNYLLFQYCETLDKSQQALLYQRLQITKDTSNYEKLEKLLNDETLNAPKDMLKVMRENQATLLKMSRFYSSLEKNKNVAPPDSFYHK